MIRGYNDKVFFCIHKSDSQIIMQVEPKMGTLGKLKNEPVFTLPGCMMTAFQIDQINLANDLKNIARNSLLILCDSEKVLHIVDEYGNGFETQNIYDIS